MTVNKHAAFSSCSSARSVQSYPQPRRQQHTGWNAPSNAPCYDARPPPARRRTTGTANKYRSYRLTANFGTWMSVQSILFVLLLSVLACCGGAEAADVVYRARHLEGQMSELLFDLSAPPAPAPRLVRRLESNDLPSSGLSSGTPSTSTSASTASGAVPTATPPSSYSLPTPFDTSLGNNFTNPACPEFFREFLTNGTFQDCLPFSLLLQTSNSFFSASRSLVRLTQTLDATCSVNLPQCSAVMSSLASQIQEQDICGADLQLQNPVVMQAYNGLIAYEPMYRAGCLQDYDGNYCFANAVTNSSSPTSSYIYYIPLGVQLPGGTRPTCNTCTQSTMQIFSSYASNSTQPLSNTYGPAADQIDMACGPTFVRAVATSPSTVISAPSSGLISMIVLVALSLNFFT